METQTVGCGQQIMAGRHLIHPFKEGAVGHGGTGGVLVEVLMIPSRGHASGKERLHLRRQIECVVVHRVVERLYAESIARCEQASIPFIPQHESELTAKVLQRMRPQFFVKMQCDFAV